MNKLIVLVVLVGIGYMFRGPLEDMKDKVMALKPMYQTRMDMRTYEDDLVAYIDREGKPPESLTWWIDEHFPPSRPGQVASADRYGQPYQATMDRERRIWVLRSCGPDEQCFTEDDLTLDLVDD